MGSAQGERCVRLNLWDKFARGSSQRRKQETGLERRRGGNGTRQHASRNPQAKRAKGAVMLRADGAIYPVSLETTVKRTALTQRAGCAVTRSPLLPTSSLEAAAQGRSAGRGGPGCDCDPTAHNTQPEAAAKGRVVDEEGRAGEGRRMRGGGDQHGQGRKDERGERCGSSAFAPARSCLACHKQPENACGRKARPICCSTFLSSISLSNASCARSCRVHAAPVTIRRNAKPSTTATTPSSSSSFTFRRGFVHLLLSHPA